MANPRQKDDEALRQEARSWVVKLTSGTATDADAWQLSAWRNRSPAHEGAYRDAVSLWNQLAPVANRQALADSTLQQRRRVVRRRRLIGGGAAVAASVGLIVTGERLALIPSVDEMLAEYRTGTGEQRRLTLADGSLVEMNTQTSLSVRYSAAERQVTLAGGEATFTVQADPQRPFIVAAAGGETRAIGTVFDVRRDGGVVCVTCLEGKVEVRRHTSTVLLPAQHVRYSDAGLGAVATVDPDLITGWRQGILVFRDETLAGVVAELNRYRPGLIVLAGGDHADQHVSGVFHLDRLAEVMEQLERIGGVRALALPGRLVILR